jgi:Leishmanolysin
MCGWIYSTDTVEAATPYGQAVMSRVSLAVLEDLGYYANIAGHRAGALPWSRDAGCEFFATTCEAYSAAHPEQPWFLGSTGQACHASGCAALVRVALHSLPSRFLAVSQQYLRPLMGRGTPCRTVKATSFGTGVGGCNSLHRSYREKNTCNLGAATQATGASSWM